MDKRISLRDRWQKISPIGKSECKERIIRNCISKMKESRLNAFNNIRQKFISSNIINETIVEGIDDMEKANLNAAFHHQPDENFGNDYYDLMEQIETALRAELRYFDIDDIFVGDVSQGDYNDSQANIGQYGQANGSSSIIENIGNGPNFPFEEGDDQITLICPICRMSNMLWVPSKSMIFCDCGCRLPLFNTKSSIFSKDDNRDCWTAQKNIQQLRSILAELFDRHFSLWLKMTESHEGMNSLTPCTPIFQQKPDSYDLCISCNVCGFHEQLCFQQAYFN